MATGGIPHGADDLRHPVYAGAYVFGRTTQRTHVVDGRARRTTGHSKPMTAWNVLLRDRHPGYITWEQVPEENQKLISENAHMQRRTERKSARGGRALLTGLVVLRPLRADDAGVLWLSIEPRTPLLLPRR